MQSESVVVSEISKPEVRTARRYCPICTVICRILVDVAGDELLRVDPVTGMVRDSCVPVSVEPAAAG